jgi:hypothetical protein
MMWRRRRFSVPLRHQPQPQESLDTTAVVPTPGAVDGSGYGGPEPPATTQSASVHFALLFCGHDGSHTGLSRQTVYRIMA